LSKKSKLDSEEEKKDQSQPVGPPSAPVESIIAQHTLGGNNRPPERPPVEEEKESEQIVENEASNNPLRGR